MSSTRTSYVAQVGGLTHRVDPDSAVEVWIVRTRGVFEPLGSLTWRAIADRELGAQLVTRTGGGYLPIVCAAFTEEEADVLSSADRALILETLRELGHPEIAERCALALDRITKTDPPPPHATPTEMRAAGKGE